MPPPTYLAVLSGLSESSKWFTHPAAPDVHWRLFGAEDLLASVEVDELKGARWRLVGLLASSLLDLDLPGRQTAILRDLRETLTIATADGGYIVISEDQRVQQVSHDPIDVTVLSGSFGGFWAEVSHTSDELANTPQPVQDRLAGSWKPDSSKTERDPEFFRLTAPTLTLDRSGLATQDFPDGSRLVGPWAATDDELTLVVQGHELEYAFHLQGDILDLTALSDGGHLRLLRIPEGEK